ncbi:hypothetical protein ACS0TY_026210 [Phlomoides rotata]
MQSTAATQEDNGGERRRRRERITAATVVVVELAAVVVEGLSAPVGTTEEEIALVQLQRLSSSSSASDSATEPFCCGVILGGYDRDGPQLYMVEPSGISYRLLLKMYQKLMVEVVRRLQPSEWRSREEATSALDQLHEVEKEVKSLRTITQRMILTRDEMEEVVLKRCWLARCGSLCVRYGKFTSLFMCRAPMASFCLKNDIDS